jgi:hypothetical protein
VVGVPAPRPVGRVCGRGNSQHEAAIAAVYQKVDTGPAEHDDLVLDVLNQLAPVDVFNHLAPVVRIERHPPGCYASRASGPQGPSAPSSVTFALIG